MPGAGKPAEQADQRAYKGKRKVYFPGGFQDVAVYDRYRLLSGMHLEGPAIIEERESTVVVGPDSHFHIDQQWNLVVAL
jgi:N-methylhydantoinase A/oxoprolinase/acetone carboxylase beta subunit